MKTRISRLLIACVAICVLAASGWFIGAMVTVPEVATWPVVEAVVAGDPPSHRIILRQIKALTKRDPAEAAAIVWIHEDPWLYGVRFGDGWIVPGIPDDHPVLTKRRLPVRVISWTGGTSKSKNASRLDRVAVEYAEVYNIETVRILSTG